MQALRAFGSRSAFQCPSSTPSPNLITLSQTTVQPLNPTVVSCGNLSAVMTNISGTCYTSVLTIPTPQYYNGTTVQCVDISLNTVGSGTLNVQLACKLMTYMYMTAYFPVTQQLMCFVYVIDCTSPANRAFLQ